MHSEAGGNQLVKEVDSCEVISHASEKTKLAVKREERSKRAFTFTVLCMMHRSIEEGV